MPCLLFRADINCGYNGGIFANLAKYSSNKDNKMPKLAQFTLLDGESGRYEKTEIVVTADHVMYVKPAGRENSILVLSNGADLRVACTVEAAFHKLVG